MCKLFEEKLVFTTSILYLDFVMIRYIHFTWFIDTGSFIFIFYYFQGGGFVLGMHVLQFPFEFENINFTKNLTINWKEITSIWPACRVFTFLDQLMHLVKRGYNVIGVSFSSRRGGQDIYILYSLIHLIMRTLGRKHYLHPNLNRHVNSLHVAK